MNPYTNVSEVKSISYSEPNNLIVINNSEVSSSIDSSLLSCLGISSGYFKKTHSWFKPECLSEAFSRLTEPVYLVSDDSGNQLGVTPSWKLEANVMKKVTNYFKDTDYSLMHPEFLDYIVVEVSRFDMSDSSFAVQIYLNSELYGPKPSTVGLRIGRLVCQNGMISNSFNISATTEGLSATLETFFKSYYDIADRIPDLLETSKKMKFPLDSIYSNIWFAKLPLTVQKYTKEYIFDIYRPEKRSDLEVEFPFEYKDTLYGQLNAVTAAARRLPIQNRTKVESKIMQVLISHTM